MICQVLWTWGVSDLSSVVDIDLSSVMDMGSK